MLHAMVGAHKAKWVEGTLTFGLFSNAKITKIISSTGKDVVYTPPNHRKLTGTILECFDIAIDIDIYAIRMPALVSAAFCA